MLTHHRPSTLWLWSFGVILIVAVNNQWFISFKLMVYSGWSSSRTTHTLRLGLRSPLSSILCWSSSTTPRRLRDGTRGSKCKNPPSHLMGLAAHLSGITPWCNQHVGEWRQGQHIDGSTYASNHDFGAADQVLSARLAPQSCAITKIDAKQQQNAYTIHVLEGCINMY